MANVLVVAELAEDGKLKKSTLSAVSFARQALPAVGGALHIVVLGASTAAASAELASYGAAKIITVEDPSLAQYTAEHFAPLVQAGEAGPASPKFSSRAAGSENPRAPPPCDPGW